MASRRSYESCVAQKNELQRREDATRSRRPYCGVGWRQPPNLSALNKGTTIPSSLFSPSLGGQQHRLSSTSVTQAQENQGVAGAWISICRPVSAKGGKHDLRGSHREPRGSVGSGHSPRWSFAKLCGCASLASLPQIIAGLCSSLRSRPSMRRLLVGGWLCPNRRDPDHRYSLDHRPPRCPCK